jgi:hypothetical protein
MPVAPNTASRAEKPIKALEAEGWTRCMLLFVQPPASGLQRFFRGEKGR